MFILLPSTHHLFCLNLTFCHRTQKELLTKCQSCQKNISFTSIFEPNTSKHKHLHYTKMSCIHNNYEVVKKWTSTGKTGAWRRYSEPNARQWFKSQCRKTFAIQMFRLPIYLKTSALWLVKCGMCVASLQ